MGLIEGTDLKFAELRGPKPILMEILRNIKVTHQKAGLIHSDLSEYNILIKPNGRLLIIDWPQSVSTDHPNAQDYLKRDVLNILACFRRKAGPEPDLDNVLAYVTGKSRTLIL
jgi:RIO kinase 2